MAAQPPLAVQVVHDRHYRGVRERPVLAQIIDHFPDQRLLVPLPQPVHDHRFQLTELTHLRLPDVPSPQRADVLLFTKTDRTRRPFTPEMTRVPATTSYLNVSSLLYVLVDMLILSETVRGEPADDADAAIRQLYALHALALRRYVERFCPDWDQRRRHRAGDVHPGLAAPAAAELAGLPRPAVAVPGGPEPAHRRGPGGSVAAGHRAAPARRGGPRLHRAGPGPTSRSWPNTRPGGHQLSPRTARSWWRPSTGDVRSPRSPASSAYPTARRDHGFTTPCWPSAGSWRTAEAIESP